MTRAASWGTTLLLVAALSHLGCSAEPPAPFGNMAVRFIPNDFQRLDQPPSEERSWVGVAGILLDGGYPPDERPWIAYFRSHMYLVSVETGMRVPGAVMRAPTTIGGTLLLSERGAGWVQLSFVPERHLPDGWYVLVVDVSDPPEPVLIGAGSLDLGGQRYGRRVQVGSASHWYETMVSCSDEPGLAVEGMAGCYIGVAFTGPVDALDGARFELSSPGSIRCTELGSEQPIFGAAWGCAEVPAGTEYQVRLVSDGAVTSLPGAPTSQTFVVDDPNWSARLPLAPNFGVDAARGAL